MGRTKLMVAAVGVLVSTAVVTAAYSVGAKSNLAAARPRHPVRQGLAWLPLLPLRPRAMAGSRPGGVWPAPSREPVGTVRDGRVSSGAALWSARWRRR